MNQNLYNFSKQFITDRFMAVISCVFNNLPRSFTCWYCVHNGSLYWKSRTQSTHSRAFETNPEACVCIYDHDASYPDDKTGVQILGTVRKVNNRVEMEAVIETFARRFGKKVYQKNNLDELCIPNTNSTFYAFTPRQLKLVAKKINVHMEEYEDYNLTN